jgi:hypothetical protein
MSSLTSDIYEVAKWIDVSVISGAIFDQKGINTVEQAKEVWLDFLETELPDGLKRSAQAVLQRHTPKRR